MSLKDAVQYIGIYDPCGVCKEVIPLLPVWAVREWLERKIVWQTRTATLVLDEERLEVYNELLAELEGL
jgi:hypothetical protein